MPMVGTKRVYAGKSSYQSKRRKPTLSNQVSLLQKQLARQRNVGHIDAVDSDANANTTADIFLVSGVAQGTDADERLGNSITLMGVEYRIAMFPGSTQTTNQTATAIIVLDHNPNGGTFSATDLLVSASPRQFPNWENKQRFKILKRVTMTVGDVTDSTGLYPISHGFIPLRNVTSTFTGTAGAAANLVTNAIFVFVIGDAATDDSAKPRVQVDTRVTFNQ